MGTASLEGAVIDHILELISSTSRRMSLVLHAYFDESGKYQDSDFICLAGYISDDDRWSVFCTEWAGLLAKHHIPYVHMKNFMVLQGEYKELGWTADHRDMVLREFFDVIRRNIMAAFLIGFDAKHYRSMSVEARKCFGDPVVFCFQRLIESVVKRVSRLGSETKVVMVFDDDEDYAMRCYRLWCDLRTSTPEMGTYIPSVCFADDKVFAPLQGADILAHQTRRFMLDLVAGTSPREAFIDLLTSPNPAYGIEYITEVWAGVQIDGFVQGRRA